MAYVVTLKGSYNVPLVYNANNQYAVKARYGGTVTQGEPRPVWHASDEKEPDLVDLIEQNGTAAFGLIVDGSSIDDVLNAIAAIRVLIDEAAQASIHGDTDAVTLQLQRNGATNRTAARVVYGHVDDSAAHYTGVSSVNNFAYGVVVYLTLAPSFDRANASTGVVQGETLKNMCKQPAFLLEGSTAGLAAGWSTTGSPSVSFNTTYYLVGVQSQQINSTGSGQGIRSTVVANPTGDYVHGYIWVATGGGNLTITFAIKESSFATTVASVSIDTGAFSGYDRTTVGPDGKTWYRYSLSGTPATTTSVGLEVTATEAGVWVVDAAYLEVEPPSGIPDSWASYYKIENRYDFSTANPDRINHLDVALVPGDAPAQVKIEMDNLSNSATGYVIGYLRPSSYAPSRLPYWRDSSLFTKTGTWAADGTGTSGNHYNETTGSGALYYTSALDYQMLRRQWRVFGLVYATATTATFQYRIYSGASAVSGVRLDAFVTASVPSGSTSKWVLLELATLSFPNLLDSSGSVTLSEEVHVVAGGATCRFDALLYMPVDQAIVAEHFDTSAAAQDVYLVDGRLRDTATTLNIYTSGRIDHVHPRRASRFVFAFYDAADIEYTLATTAELTTTITPRTRHMLGTT